MPVPTQARFPPLIRFRNRSADAPVLLGLSFPKSGTHLLEQILTGFSRVAPYAKRPQSYYVEYDGPTGRKKPPESAMAWLDTLRPGHVATSHLFARPEVVKRVQEPQFAPYFIVRDPRDIVVSHAFFVDSWTDHVHHAYYKSLPDFNSRLAVSISGRAEVGVGVEFPNIGERFAPHLDWLGQPGVLSIRFEELINNRTAGLTRIIDHLLARTTLQLPRHATLDALERSVNPARSATYRSGKTGEWRKYFTNEHRDLFKDVAGDLLIRLGYEQNLDW